MSEKPINTSSDAIKLYQQALLKHHKLPVGFEREIKSTHSADGVNAACGDEITVYAQIVSGNIIALGFSGDSCAICRASASIMCQYLTHRKIDEVDAFIEGAIDVINSAKTDESVYVQALEPLLAVRKFPVRKQCAILPWRTFAKALFDT